MFLAWALLSDLGGEIHTVDLEAELSRLKQRMITPGEYLFSNCDGKLTNEDLNETGNTFAAWYFKSQYPNDYGLAFGDALPSLYHVKDSWDTYGALQPILDARMSEFSQ